ncbi:hypothetical protein [Streptomyces sp. NBC_00467]|uniref:hypothetical protein n=1 Tax=Streptomyces sp. NBC_00467 TaxID=2975752 RepID=UPI002E17C5C8
MPIHVQPNTTYFGETITMFLLIAFLAYIPLWVFHLPGWLAWVAAALHLVDELRRSRNNHIELAGRWNDLLDDWLVHETRVHEQRRAQLPHRPQDGGSGGS